MVKSTVIRVIRLVLGWACVVLGVIGLFVPILQGVLLILLGMALLSRDSRRARRCLLKMRLRYPEAYAAMQRLKARLAAPFARAAERDES
jgi:uncharacterized membrane protein YbaN (DUF454 family)